MPQAGDGRPKKARGRLLVDTLGIAFCSGQLQSLGWPVGSGPDSVCHEPSCAQGGELRPIPYENISLLARGRITEAGGVLSEMGDVAVPVVSFATLVASITTTGATRNWLIGATLGSAGLAVGLHELLVHRGNYVAVFFDPSKLNKSKDTPCEAEPPNAGRSDGHQLSHPPGGPAGKSTGSPASKAPNLFLATQGCDLAVFQISSPHDYWDLSMILNARTGQEFVSEAAEQK